MDPFALILLTGSCRRDTTTLPPPGLLKLTEKCTWLRGTAGEWTRIFAQEGDALAGRGDLVELDAAELQARRGPGGAAALAEDGGGPAASGNRSRPE